MISLISHKLSAWRFSRELERNLAARKQARLNGQTYVSGYTRRKAAA